ncbi:MAG: nitroreductase family protein [Schleiferiaceae bacterium]
MSTPESASSVDIFNNAPKHGYEEPAAPMDAAAFTAVVESRRSVRVYTDEAIPEATVRECLRLALLAPNSSNLQTWDFYWVRTPDKKAELVRYCLNQPAARTAQELIVAVARPDRWRETNALMLAKFDESRKVRLKAAYQYYRKIVPLAYNMGPLGLYGPFKTLWVALVGLVKPIPRGPFSLAGMATWAHKSTALACENLMLAFRAHGYDSCPMEGMDGARIKTMLGLPRGAQVCMVISAGKRAPEGVYGPRVRFDQKLFVHEV